MQDILSLFTQIYDVETSSFKVIATKTGSRENKLHYIIEFPSALANKITSEKHLFIGLNKIYVKLFRAHYKCTRCLSLIHTARDCLNQLFCTFCSQPHPSEICPHPSNFRCINCVDFNKKNKSNLSTDHPADSPCCASAIDYINKLKEKKSIPVPSSNNKRSEKNKNVTTNLPSKQPVPPKKTVQSSDRFPKAKISQSTKQTKFSKNTRSSPPSQSNINFKRYMSSSGLKNYVTHQKPEGPKSQKRFGKAPNFNRKFNPRGPFFDFSHLQSSSQNPPPQNYANFFNQNDHYPSFYRNPSYYNNEYDQNPSYYNNGYDQNFHYY